MDSLAGEIAGGALADTAADAFRRLRTCAPRTSHGPSDTALTAGIALQVLASTGPGPEALRAAAARAARAVGGPAGPAMRAVREAALYAVNALAHVADMRVGPGALAANLGHAALEPILAEADGALGLGAAETACVLLFGARKRVSAEDIALAGNVPVARLRAAASRVAPGDLGELQARALAALESSASSVSKKAESKRRPPVQRAVPLAPSANHESLMARHYVSALGFAPFAV